MAEGMTTRPYLVRQGDYLTKLAFQHGFRADDVWNAPENADLKARRESMDVLAPGDVLQIPDGPPPPLALSVGSSNQFKAVVPKVHVRVVLREADEPLANEPYRVEGLAEPVDARSGPDGAVELDVPIAVRSLRLVLHERHVAFPILVGHLNPADTASGARQRLDHLGYYGWRVQRVAHRAAHAHWDSKALRAFQRDQRLPITGELDDATVAALRTAHGS